MKPVNPQCPRCNKAVTPMYDEFLDVWIVAVCQGCVERAEAEIRRSERHEKIQKALGGVMTAREQKTIVELMRSINVRGEDGIGHNLEYVIDRWGQSRRWAMLHGDTESGKTTKMFMFVWLLVRKCIDNNQRSPSIAYVTSPELADELNDFKTKVAALELYTTADVLLLDEVDGVIGDRDLQQLYRVIDGRHRNGKITVVASNLKPSELTDAIGGRTARRILNNCGPDGIIEWTIEGEE